MGTQAARDIEPIIASMLANIEPTMFYLVDCLCGPLSTVDLLFIVTASQMYGPAHTSQQTQNICITFAQCRTNVEDVGPTLYKCYTNVLCLLGFQK